MGENGSPARNSALPGIRSSAPGGAGEWGRGGSVGAPSQPGGAGCDGGAAGGAPRAVNAPVRAAGDPELCGCTSRFFGVCGLSRGRIASVLFIYFEKAGFAENGQ